ncbi:Holliday junction resolvase RecU [Fructilactobacillus florum]|uniref:Holliday junction resolvase RecU n=1 Tax=Fructilactobacillus florum TaxID=640331 RepID=UPI00028D22D8|nr:Holliday junction resolvase RecU [Fructilactobacillus florum]EKK20964.1 Recombination protein RecU [Fructilactobacillus florum 2F]
MTIHYPNGHQYHPRPSRLRHTNQLYSISHADRGMSLEQAVNESNQYYRARNKAVIHKKPTPIQIVDVSYPKRSAAVIREAYFQAASTTDYNGIYRGHYIDFDAKETTNKTSFPLANFHAHQIQHLRDCFQLGGICFALISFKPSNELFLLNGPDLFSAWDLQSQGGRKSIPKKQITQKGYALPYRFNPVIPYLDAVDKIIAAHKGEKNEF